MDPNLISAWRVIYSKRVYFSDYRSLERVKKRRKEKKKNYRRMMHLCMKKGQLTSHYLSMLEKQPQRESSLEVRRSKGKERKKRAKDRKGIGPKGYREELYAFQGSIQGNQVSLPCYNVLLAF